MKHHRTQRIVIWSIASICVIAIGYGGLRLIELSQAYRASRTTITELRETITELSTNLSLSEYERDKLSQVLTQTADRAAQLESTSTELASTVDALTKLSETDPELLKKYSKVYFLNEHYTPTSLTDIDPEYISAAGKTVQIHTQVWPYLKQLLDDAASAGLGLRIASGYRSFGTQASLKSTYRVTYGAATANKFSADQGYSEHQLGTAVDFTTAKTGTLSTAFDKTPESIWLKDNAHKYGFVLSYPKNNKYYIYEPWHWRFVGVALATMLHEENTYLYDIDQREIDTYLGTIFDQESLKND